MFDKLPLALNQIDIGWLAKMSAVIYLHYSDDELREKAKRLLKSAEHPVISVGAGAQNVTLSRHYNPIDQLRDVTMEMHRRGRIDASDYLHKEQKLRSVDPRLADRPPSVIQ